MTADTASEQGVLETRDVPTLESGQLPDGVLAVAPITQPQTPDTTEEPEEAPVPEQLEPKDKRKSDKEWQEAQEKAKDAEKLAEQLAKTNRRLERLEFEKQFPVAEQYKDKLDAMEKDPRFAPFSWEERLQFIHKADTTQVKKDMASQVAKTEGSVMGSARPSPGQEPIIVPDSAATWFGSREEAEKLYRKYQVR